MRGRPRASRSSDAASAARRRLAALAAQFEETSPRDESFEQQPSPLSGDRPPGRHAARDAEDGSAPRQRSDDVPCRTGHPEHGRWALSHQHLTLILLAVVAVVAVAGWWVLRSVPSSEPVQIASQRTLPSTGGPAIDATGEDPSTAGQTAAAASTALTSVTAPAGADASGTLVVDVAGKVRRPGIVELPSGSRVVDALQRAGGVRPRVDTTGLNLARLLVDGEQIVVGVDLPQIVGAPGADATASTDVATTGPSPVDLNTATQEQLESLPDIGPVTAQAILTWRTENGFFTSVDELLEVSGIGDATLADVAPFVFV